MDADEDGGGGVTGRWGGGIFEGFGVGVCLGGSLLWGFGDGMGWDGMGWAEWR